MVPSWQAQPARGDAADGSQVYPVLAHRPAATAVITPGVTRAGSQPTRSFPANPGQRSAQDQLMHEQSEQCQQQLQQKHERQLEQFWAEQRSEIEQATGIKNYLLPLTRIKKIMKADEDVQMIATEAPALFAKACEMFALDLTMRSWMLTEENKRRVLQKSDIAAAIARTDVYDFLMDVVPMDEKKKEKGGVLPRTGQQPMAMGAPVDAYPYYNAPQQQVPGASMAYGGQQQQGSYVWEEPQQQEQGHPSAYVWEEPQEQEQVAAASMAYGGQQGHRSTYVWGELPATAEQQDFE